MSKQQFNASEWSPFELNHDYKDVTTKQLAGGAEKVAFRIKSLGALLGIASASHDFSIEEGDVEDVGFMIQELAMLSSVLVHELGDRVVKAEEENDNEGDDEEEDDDEAKGEGN